MEKKNSYAREANKKKVLGGLTADLETKGDVKNSAIETVKDLVVGVIAGGAVGAALGRVSLAVGAVVTGIGHYTKSRLASIFGVGMMAASGYQKPKEEMSGKDKPSMVDDAKERVVNFKDSFAEKLFLDKVLKSKKESTTDTGTTTSEAPLEEPMGQLAEFDPVEIEDEVFGASGSMDELDRIEEMIQASAGDYADSKDLNTDHMDETTGEIMGDLSDDLDPDDQNY